MPVPFANGILHVNAKDLGTGKQQSIQITASSGLTEQEIKQMVQDAEAHANEGSNRTSVQKVSQPPSPRPSIPGFAKKTSL